jgi:hypothetical protein
VDIAAQKEGTAMAERILITKVKRTDQTRSRVYGKGHQYAESPVV